MIIYLSNIDVDTERLEELYDYDEGVLIIFDTGVPIIAVFLQDNDAETVRAWLYEDERRTSDGPANWSYINEMINKTAT